VEAKLSDQLIEATAEGDGRKRAEKLFTNYDHVEVKVKRGRFRKLCGPEKDINRIELELMRTYVPDADCVGISELCSSDLAMVNGRACVAYQIPLENEDQQQQQQKQDGRVVKPPPEQIPSSLPTPPSVPTATAENSRDPISPVQRHHKEPHGRAVTTEKPDERFIDEMDVDKYVWHYMLFKYAESIKDLASKHFCGLTLRRTSVDANGKVQCRLQVAAPTQAGLNSAYDKLAEMVVKLTDANVTQQTVELCPKEYFDELTQELAKKEIVLMSSRCHVVGPASALEAAQSTVKAAVDKIFARKSPPFAVSIDDPEKDIFTFHIPLVGITVHIRQGIAAFIFLLGYILTYYTDVYHCIRNGM